MAFPAVTEDNVYTCVGHPLKSDITNMVDWMLNESFANAYDNILNLKTLKGLSLQVITNTAVWIFTCFENSILQKGKDRIQHLPSCQICFDQNIGK